MFGLRVIDKKPGGSVSTIEWLFKNGKELEDKGYLISFILLGACLGAARKRCDMS